MKLSNDQRKILTALKIEPGEGWLTNAHIAKTCGKGDNRSWASSKLPALRDRGLVEYSGDRVWRRITDLGRAALSEASRGQTEER